MQSAALIIPTIPETPFLDAIAKEPISALDATRAQRMLAGTNVVSAVVRAAPGATARATNPLLATPLLGAVAVALRNEEDRRLFGLLQTWLGEGITNFHESLSKIKRPAAASLTLMQFLKSIILSEETLGYLLTAWPFLTQYVSGPFDTRGIPGQPLKDSFSAGGSFVNVGLGGELAGPLMAAFAKLLWISIFATIPQMVTDREYREIIFKSSLPEEWTAKYLFSLSLQAKAKKRDSCYIALKQSAAVMMPLARLVSVGIAAYLSWYLAEALTKSAFTAENDVKYPYLLVGIAALITAIWMMVVNALLYVAGLVQALLKNIGFSRAIDSEGKKDRAAITDNLAIIRFMDIPSELEALRRRLNFHLSETYDSTQRDIDTFIRKANVLELESEQFLESFEDFLVSLSTEEPSVCLPPQIIQEACARFLASKTCGIDKAELFRRMEAVINKPSVSVILEAKALGPKREAERALIAILRDTPSVRGDSNPVYRYYKGVLRGPAAFLTSMIFGLTMVKYVQDMTGCDLATSIGASMIVTYFSTAVFGDASVGASNTVIRVARNLREQPAFAASLAVCLLVGLGVAALSGGTAMYQSSSSSEPPEYVKWLLNVLCFGKPEAIPYVSAINAAMVNSFGAVGLIIKILINLMILGTILKATCRPTAAAIEHDVEVDIGGRAESPGVEIVTNPGDERAATPAAEIVTSSSLHEARGRALSGASGRTWASSASARLNDVRVAPAAAGAGRSLAVEERSDPAASSSLYGARARALSGASARRGSNAATMLDAARAAATAPGSAAGAGTLNPYAING